MDLEPGMKAARSTSRSSLPTQFSSWKVGCWWYLRSATSYTYTPHTHTQTCPLMSAWWSGLGLNPFSGSVVRVVLFLRAMGYFPEVCGKAYIFCIRLRACFLLRPCSNAQRCAKPRGERWASWALSYFSPARVTW